MYFSRLMDEASEKLPKETLESILMALDDQKYDPLKTGVG